MMSARRGAERAGRVCDATMWRIVRCVIVDDNADFIDAASQLLERDGVSVVAASSGGDQARDSVARLQPDVVLIDVNLGGENGFDLANQLADDGFPRERVVFISARAAADFIALVSSSGAAGFLTKHALSGTAIADIVRAADAGTDSVE